jgi:ADP-ribose pyrophosphatase YjhB (NUDIX family)
VKFGETLHDAVNREVHEEFGVVPQKIEFLGFGDIHREHEGQKTHWIAFRYKVIVDRDLVVNNEPDKHEEIGWYRLDDLPSPLHSAIPKELAEYKDLLI